MKSSRSLVFALAVAASSVLSACGASAPPAKELANDLIDTLDVSDSIKVCMHNKVADFALTEADLKGFKDFDEVAKKADQGQADAKKIVARFEAELATCTSPGG